ncbi:MAG: M20 family metallo-hydrolase [Rikenellaceae bacterium]|jgi:acetylornithine deacetylase|nr:M20 family metallo-hydrolase [Rikenellaceae bacterium]
MSGKFLHDDAVALLRQMIATPSVSGEEEDVCSLIAGTFENRDIAITMTANNIVARNRYFSPDRPTILLNSHLDTVKPNPGYTRDPFAADIAGDVLYGLGSNDAGASVVSLIAAFLHFYERTDLKYNLILAITAQEEISGDGGLALVLPDLGPLDFAIVGEPTGMDLAIAERGLIVLDCVARGVSGHAARGEGVNAVYEAIPDIEWFRTFRFPKKSPLLGEVGMNVTMISAGTQHNVVPAECRFTVDIRVTERYTNTEIVEIVRRHVKCEVTPRSLKHKSSSIDPAHPAVQAGMALGLKTYASPTMSDQTKLFIPSLKMGPGQSSRSHSADEFVLLPEIEHGIDTYIKILTALL